MPSWIKSNIILGKEDERTIKGDQKCDGWNHAVFSVKLHRLKMPFALWSYPLLTFIENSVKEANGGRRTRRKNKKKSEVCLKWPKSEKSSFLVSFWPMGLYWFINPHTHTYKPLMDRKIFFFSKKNFPKVYSKPKDVWARFTIFIEIQGRENFLWDLSLSKFSWSNTSKMTFTFLFGSIAFWHQQSGDNEEVKKQESLWLNQAPLLWCP